MLKLEKRKILKEKKNALGKTTTGVWEEVTPYLVTLHVNFEDNVFGLEEFDISTKYNLALVTKEGSSIIHKEFKMKISNISAKQTYFTFFITYPKSK